MKFLSNTLSLLFCFIISIPLVSQNDSVYDVSAHYNKREVDIAMRDGVKLHTTIYSPKDISKEYPIIMKRTPYSSQPYAKIIFRRGWGPIPP